MTGLDSTLIITIVVIMGIGGSLYFVGFLVALATALGTRRWLWSIGMTLFFPLALVYSLLNRQIAAWPLKLLLGGFAALLMAAVLGGIFFPQLYHHSESGQPIPFPAENAPKLP